MGFAAVELALDTNAIFREDRSGIVLVESFLWTALTKLGALYGYLTNYERHLEDDLESKVFMPFRWRIFNSTGICRPGARLKLFPPPSPP